MNGSLRCFALIVLTVVAGCTGHKKASPTGAQQSCPAILSDTSQMKVLACEFLIKEALKYRTTPMLFFVSLNRDERTSLRHLVPECDIRPENQAEFLPGLGVRDKLSRKAGTRIGVKVDFVSEKTANARGALIRNGGVVFSLQFRKDSNWTLEGATRMPWNF